MKLKDDEGVDDEVKKVNTLALQLAALILANSKGIMNNFIHAIGGFFTIDVRYTDTDSLYIENKHWDKLNKANLIGKNLLQGKKDYKDGGNFYGLFLAPKLKHCLTTNKYGGIEKHKTFKGFSFVSNNLDRRECSKRFEGDKLKAKTPLSWKKSCNQAMIIPHKMRNCIKYANDILCDGYDKIVNQSEEISANLNELKGQPPNEVGHKLPK